MAKKTQAKKHISFKLGDRVRLKDLPGLVGRIEELRGPLGPGGTAVYRVKVRRKPGSSSIELLGNQLEILDEAGRRSSVKGHKVAPKTSETKEGR